MSKTSKRSNYYVPTTVSPEAQTEIRRFLPVDESRAPKPEDFEAWEEFQENWEFFARNISDLVVEQYKPNIKSQQLVLDNRE